MQRLRTVFYSCVGWLLFVAPIACAAHPKKDTREAPRAVAYPPKRAAPRAPAAEPPSVHPLAAVVPAGALGPRLIRTKGADVLAWAVPHGDGAGLYSSLVVDGKRSEPRRVAAVDPSARQLQIARDHSGDLLATMVHKVADDEVLSATRMGPQGAALTGPTVVATTPGTILYSQTVATTLGAVVLWAETVGSGADIYTVVLDKKGPHRPTRLVRGVSSWQVSSQGDSFTLVTREGGRRGSIKLRQLGDSGQVIGAPVELARDVEGATDIDLAVTKDQILVAWSERGTFHGHIVATLLDASGNVLATPAPLTEARGEQALLGVFASPARGEFWAAWEEPRYLKQGLPSVFLGTWHATTQTVSPRYRLPAVRKDQLLPLIVATADGLALIGDVSCADCDPGALSRVLGRVGSKGGAKSEVLAISESKAPSLVWDLKCEKDDCRFLLADDGSPARVYLGSARAKVSSGHLKGLVPGVPQLVSHSTLGPIPELSKMSVSRGSSHTLVSWLSYFDPAKPYVVPTQPAPDGRRAPVRARLTNVSVSSGSLGPSLSETVVSYRARSLGGVSLVAPENNRGLLAWAALDGGEPQVFLTIVDEQGKKVRQRMVTRAPGEVTDVAAVRVAGGYLVAWVDGRGPSPEIYALRVNDQLVATGKPRRVSQGARAPADVALHVTERGVFCVWSDGRTAGESRASELYGAWLNPVSAERQEAERRMTTQHEHAYAPQLEEDGVGNLWAAWISEPAAGERAGEESVVRFARVNEAGELSSEPITWKLPGTATDVSVDCSSRTCSAVAVVSRRRGGDDSVVSLFGASFRAPDSGVTGRLLLPLWTGSAEGVSPVLSGDHVYFADRQAEGDDWVLRRLQVQWAAE